jgi:glutamate formiminotransferase
MQECGEIARRLSKRVADSLGIPVYLYEEASVRPDRVNLEDIRRGEYEGIKATIATDPYREPDFGPKVMGPAGGVVIGAREPLIAYNIFLNTPDVVSPKKLPAVCEILPVVFTLSKAWGCWWTGWHRSL